MAYGSTIPSGPGWYYMDGPDSARDVIHEAGFLFVLDNNWRLKISIGGDTKIGIGAYRGNAWTVKRFE